MEIYLLHGRKSCYVASLELFLVSGIWFECEGGFSAVVKRFELHVRNLSWIYEGEDRDAAARMVVPDHCR